MKKQDNIIKISAAAAALIAVAGLSAASFAQDNGELSGYGRGSCGMPVLAEEDREAMIAERGEAREAISAAIQEGYNAWAEAIKEYRGENAPILNEVNEDNFSVFAKAHGYLDQSHELRLKARSTLEEAGIELPFRKHGRRAGLHKPLGLN